MNNSENLTLQQKRFCDEYLVSFNAFRAAIYAGYSENTARKAELLHSPKIQAYLQDAMAKTANRVQISHDMVLRELAKIAFSNIGNYYDDYGTPKPTFLLSEDEKAAISDYNVLESTDEEGNKTAVLTKIKLHNKMSALDKIARHIGFYGVGKEVVSGELRVAGIKNPEADGENKEPEFVSGELQVADQEVVSGELQVAGVEVEKREEEKIIGDSTTEPDTLMLVVNNTGELASETLDAIDMVKEPAMAGKILTLSPLKKEAGAENQEARIKKEL